VSATDDHEPAVRAADVISTATMASEPILRGAWLRPGQHLDLIGGYRTDMREADDECIARGRVFVDSRRTSADVGDIAGPRSTGVLADITADFADLRDGGFARTSEDEITVFKNAGGAHLDLMVARYFERVTLSARPAPPTVES
jgi:ornithine cyclodeaminase